MASGLNILGIEQEQPFISPRVRRVESVSTFDSQEPLNQRSEFSTQTVARLLESLKLNQEVERSAVLPFWPDLRREAAVRRDPVRVVESAGKERYPLRGTLLWYDSPTEPVGEEDWDLE